MLVLNAGFAEALPLVELEGHEVESMVNINALHVVYTVKALVAQQLERYARTGKKSGIFVTSSGLGDWPVPGSVTYSGAKAFASLFIEGLHAEFEGKIDCLAWHAGMLKTKFL